MTSTGLAFAAGFGTLAALNTEGNHGMQFTWHWTVIPWMVVGALGNWRLWVFLLESEGNLSAQGKKKFFIYCGLLASVGLGAFLYPIRFVDQSRFGDLAQGLVAAAGVLSAMGWMIHQLGRAFAKADSIELAHHGSLGGEGGGSEIPENPPTPADPRPNSSE